MKHALTLLLLFVTYCLSAQNNATHVITHNRVTINTNPKTGEKVFSAWGVFPKPEVPVRKITMHITLGCPDTMPCAHWDYLDFITVRRTGGVSGKFLDYELGRMLTPYGSIFTREWHWTWDTDVTDFSMVLRDSIEIEYKHTGYETETVGWALTIDFEIITGKEIAKPLSITRLYQGSFAYGNPENDSAKTLAPVKYFAVPGSSINRIRIQHTGHGMDEPSGCSEFCSRWRDVIFDSRTVDHRDIWKECGTNPLYPQGGTWIYDRGYWCPGYLQPPDIIDVVSEPGNHTVDIDMMPYHPEGKSQANESITAYLIQYTQPLNRNDAAIEKILIPSNDKNFSRMNPACEKPRIVIRNLGSENLTSVLITYGSKGHGTSTYHWKGNLSFYQAAEINLEGMINYLSEKNIFKVNLSMPNGKKDEWAGDNSMETQYSSPVTLPDQFILQFRTNNHPEENTLSITGKNGNTVFEKRGNLLTPNTLYTDTIRLEAGCCELILNDTADNGLEFWYEPEGGYGYLRILDLKGRLIQNFESDFGRQLRLGFTATPAAGYDTTTARFAFVLFPRRTSDKITLDVLSSYPSQMTVIITSDGKEVQRHEYASVKQGEFTFNTAYLPAGRYIMEVLMDNVSRMKRRFNKEDTK